MEKICPSSPNNMGYYQENTSQMHRSAVKLALLHNYPPPQIQDEVTGKMCSSLDDKDSLPLTYTKKF